MFSNIIFTLLITFVFTDIAPWGYSGTASGAVFSSFPSVEMVSYYVETEIDVPYISENYTYFLQNTLNSTFEVDCIIPYDFLGAADYSGQFELTQKKLLKYNITINDIDVTFNVTPNVNVTLPENVTSLITTNSFSGFTLSVPFEPFQIVKVQLNAKAFSLYDSYYVNHFYFYTAATSSFWGQSTVDVASFKYKHVSNVHSWVKTSVPSGEVIDTTAKTVVSYKTNFDASDAHYEIIVDTGTRYRRAYPWFLYYMELLERIGLYALIVSPIALVFVVCLIVIVVGAIIVICVVFKKTEINVKDDVVEKELETKKEKTKGKDGGDKKKEEGEKKEEEEKKDEEEKKEEEKKDEEEEKKDEEEEKKEEEEEKKEEEKEEVEKVEDEKTEGEPDAPEEES